MTLYKLLTDIKKLKEWRDTSPKPFKDSCMLKLEAIKETIINIDEELKSEDMTLVFRKMGTMNQWDKIKKELKIE